MADETPRAYGEPEAPHPATGLVARLGDDLTRAALGVTCYLIATLAGTAAGFLVAIPAGFAVLAAYLTVAAIALVLPGGNDPAGGE